MYTIEIGSNALVALLAICFTLCWVALAGMKRPPGRRPE